jgi:hypothetical protein
MQLLNSKQLSTHFKCASAALVVALSATTTAQASMAMADWTAGTLDTLTFTTVQTETSGLFSISDYTATDPTFVSTYSDTFSRLVFGAAGTSGNLLAEITFSEPLPVGTMLLAMDLDFRDETFIMSSNLGFLSLLEQGESTNGATSFLPNYNPATGTLVETHPGNTGNSDEFARFDLSGVSSLSVQFLNGGVDSGSAIAIATPETISTIPLPAGLPLMIAGLVGLGAIRRKS